MESDALRVLVAEDDPAQLSMLVSMVGELKSSWRIVATAQDVRTVLKAVDEHAPDVLILDIHLPDASGLDWAKALPHGVAVIFVTGDPDFAVQAFESAAVDYVLKPLNARRLKMALDRVGTTSRRAPAQGDFASSHASNELHWLTAARGQDALVVPVTDIFYLQSDQKYTRIVTATADALVRTGISELQKRLNPAFFVRIHRSVIVNLRFVDSAKRDALGRLRVHLRGRPESLTVSKPYEHVFRTL
ncbi:MAG: DNA-binding response regulator [Rhizobacter sp.]|jgi:DNA-binding LytR/AlgR family response regulator|nr:DNA-binding response regulator [Rhizobacter sp.]